MRELKSIEEKILDRALYIFGKSGTSNVSIRAISKEAEVNVSAINYYFGSKEEMLKNVQAFYIENTIAAYSELDNDNLNDEEKVILCANEIMEYSLKYPGVLVMQKEAASADSNDEMAKKIIDVTAKMNNKLDETLKKVIKPKEGKFPYMRMVFLSSISYPIGDTNIEGFNKNFLDKKEERIKYIKYLINMLKENR